MDSTPSITVLTGPTASGKTALAHDLARRHGLEIISADSMQVYRDLPIATAAPSPRERSEVDYHLVGILPPTENYSAARFLRETLQVLQAQPPGRHAPLVVGGTGLYIRVLREGLFEDAGTSPDIRERLRGRLAEEGSEALHAELSRLDPEAARGIHPNDAVRIRRALEVYEATGRPISELWREGRERAAPPVRVGRMAVLAPPRDVLYKRIDARTRGMFEAGLLGELSALLQRYGLDEIDKALRPLGLRGLAEALQEGVLAPETPADAPVLEPYIEAMQRQTRRYAKRQLTWLRKYAAPGADCRWFDPTDASQVEALAELERFLLA